MTGRNATIEVSLSDFDEDDIIEYAKELTEDEDAIPSLEHFDADEIIERAKYLMRGINDEILILPDNISMVDAEKFKFLVENYENIKLEDLESLIQ